MMNGKFIIPSLLLALLLPLNLWSEVPIVDDSDNFAMAEEQQAYEAPLVNSQYGDSRLARANEGRYPKSMEEAPLVKEDNYQAPQNSRAQFNDNAKLIDKIQNLRQEIQELRGQLEMQAHDLKLLQQQQLAFYKDVDVRLGSLPNKALQSKLPIDTPVAQKPLAPAATEPLESAATKESPGKPKSLSTVSRVNPANEQISYLAAYELIKNKRYEEALQAMENFLQKYPGSGFTANADYWLGELYLLKKDFPKAKAFFETVLEQFPSSSKSSAAMLKLAYVFAASGDVLAAKQRLQEVIKTYPNTRAAQLASAKLDSLNTL